MPLMHNYKMYSVIKHVLDLYGLMVNSFMLYVLYEYGSNVCLTKLRVSEVLYKKDSACAVSVLDACEAKAAATRYVVIELISP